MGGISSRRMSRNTSSRINADQDWGITGPDGQVLPQPMQSSGGAGFAAHAGMPLHVPGPSSRRTSRTLSGEFKLCEVVLVLPKCSCHLQAMHIMCSTGNLCCSVLVRLIKL
jgi:hypothetical protein